MGANTRYFQWIASEKKGQISIFDKIEYEDGNTFIVFKDSSRINEKLVAEINKIDLSGKLMAEIDHPNNCWVFKEEWVGREEEIWEKNADGESVCVQPFVAGKKVIRLIPPKHTPPTHSVFGKISNSLSANQNIKPTTPISNEKLIQSNDTPPSLTLNTNDPVYILISKAKKVDTEISMGMVVSLPPKNLYNIAKESFEEGDKKFVEYVINEITVEEIKNALKIAITEMYENVALDSFAK